MSKKVKVCEAYSKSEDGFCENYIGNKEKKASCRYYCKVFNTNIESKVKNSLESQITGLELEYET